MKTELLNRGRKSCVQPQRHNHHHHQQQLPKTDNTTKDLLVWYSLPLLQMCLWSIYTVAYVIYNCVSCVTHMHTHKCMWAGCESEWDFSPVIQSASFIHPPVALLFTQSHSALVSPSVSALFVFHTRLIVSDSSHLYQLHYSSPWWLWNAKQELFRTSQTKPRTPLNIINYSFTLYQY